MLASIQLSRLIPGVVDPELVHTIVAPVGIDGDEADVDMTIRQQPGFRSHRFEGTAMLFFKVPGREAERCEFRGAVSGKAPGNPWYSYDGRVLVFNDDREDGVSGVALTQARHGEMNHAGNHRNPVEPIRPRVIQPNDQQSETLEDLSERASSLITLAARVVLWQHTIP